MKYSFLKYLIFHLVLTWAFSSSSFAQTVDANNSAQACSDYIKAALAINAGATIFPDSLVQDSERRIKCFGAVLDNLGSKIKPNSGIGDDVRLPLLMTTGILRDIIVAAANYDDANNSQTGGHVDTFTETFRSALTINAASALTYAMLDSNKSLRVNGLTVLENSIDNAVACVPLAHFYLIKRDTSDLSVNGRSNLLSTISIMAPWANNENGASINDTITWLEQTLNDQRNNPDFTRTFDLIKNVKARRAGRPAGGGMASADMSKCADYLATLSVSSPNLHYGH